MLQDSWLFSGTIRENIQMGFNEYDDEHVLEICKVAGSMILWARTQGYDLEVKERGIGLSGGQKQAIIWLGAIHKLIFTSRRANKFNGSGHGTKSCWVIK